MFLIFSVLVIELYLWIYLRISILTFGIIYLARFVLFMLLTSQLYLIIKNVLFLNLFYYLGVNEMFDLSDYEKLNHFLSTSNSQNDCYDCFNNPSVYFHFCYFGKIVFIHKSRRVYQVLASRSSQLNRVAEHTHFDVVSVNVTLFDAISSFYDSIQLILSKPHVVNNEVGLLEF